MRPWGIPPNPVRAEKQATVARQRTEMMRRMRILGRLLLAVGFLAFLAYTLCPSSWAQSHSGGAMTPTASNANLPTAFDNLNIGLFSKTGSFGGTPNMNGLQVTAQVANGAGLNIGRATTGTSDLYDLRCFRNANYTGGAGAVNKCLQVDSTAGAGVTAFEWNAVFKMDNFSTNTSTNQLASYFQAFKESGAGPTWATTEELRDFNVDPGSGAVTKEIDLWANGTDASGNRHVVDVVGSKLPGGSGVTPTITSGIRIGAASATAANATFTYGLNFGISGWGTLIGTTGNPTFTHGLDLSGGTCSTDCIKTNLFSVDGSGNVNIGHSGAGGSGGVLQIYENNNAGLLTTSRTDGSQVMGIYAANSPATAMQFKVNGTEAARISNGGRFLIGTSGVDDASHLLQVQGTMVSTGVFTPTGGVAASGGFSVSPRNFATCAVSAGAATSMFTDQTPVATEVYTAEVFVPANATVTGVAIRSGSVASGNVKVGLADVSGNVLKTSASTAVAGAAGVYQRVPFTSTYAATGPATYYILTFYDNTTVRASAHTQGNCGAGKLTGQTYATGFVSNASLAPTTFTSALGPVASLY